MDKTTLRSLLTAELVGKTVQVNFASTQGAPFNGEYEVRSIRRGRGKGGSLIADLAVPGTENIVLTVGTPDSDKILNITIDGQLHGYEQEGLMPVAMETDAQRAGEYKTLFKTLSVGNSLCVNSSLPSLDGYWVVTNVRQLRGRGGQVVLELGRDGGTQKAEVWSYRHSGVVTGVAKV